MSFPFRSRAVAGLLIAGALTGVASIAAAINPANIRAQAEAARPGIAGMIDPRLVALVDQEARKTKSPARLALTAAERDVISTEGIARNAVGDVSIRIHATKPALLVDELAALGATNIIPVPDAYLVECYIPVSRIADLSDLAPLGLKGAVANFAPFTNIGTVTSQADWIMEADRVAFSVPGYDGTGVTIGTLSDSFGSGGGSDLPATVDVLEDSMGTDEGRAMIELMYDLAPGANYAFATAQGGEANFANNVRRLANPADGGCRVVVDDVIYFAEPFWQNSLVGRAVNEVANTWDTVYLSAAGNYADRGWEVYFPGIALHPYYPSPGFGGYYLDLNPGGEFNVIQSFYLDPGETATVLIQWDDPFYTLNGVDTDLDVFMFPQVAGGTTIQGSIPIAGEAAVIDNILNQVPVEIISYTNDTGTGVIPSTPTPTPTPSPSPTGTATPGPTPTVGPTATPGPTPTPVPAQKVRVDMVVQRFAGPTPRRIKYIRIGGSTVETAHPRNAGTIFGHMTAENTISVGAIDYSNQNAPADFTGWGPAFRIFTDQGTYPGHVTTVNVPVISAIQHTNTTFFIPGYDPDLDGFPNFSGTSAAAPQAAAAAALYLQRFPGASRTQVRNALIAGSDNSIGTPGYDFVTGHGSLNAYDAVFGPSVVASNAAPIIEGGEAGALPQYFETRTTNNGRLLVTDQLSPDSGAAHIIMDTNGPIGVDGLASLASRNEMTLRVNLAGRTNAQLSFRVKEFNDDDHAMPTTFTGASNTDGVAYSVDGGTTWRRLVTLTGGNATSTYQTHNINLSAFASSAGVALSADTRIRFQQFGAGSIPNDGLAFDNIMLTSNGPAATPTPTPTATPGGPTPPSVTSAGLSLNIADGNQPSFVAYFVRIGNAWVYQGDSGWQPGQHDVTFENWPYSTLPLRLQGYRGIPEAGVAGINPIGSVTLSNGTITRVVEASPGGEPVVSSGGLSVNVQSPDSNPSFVAYFVRFGNTFVYQGDSGWTTATEYDITFQNWPYATSPLKLQAYRGEPSIGVPSLQAIGSTTLIGNTITRGAQ